MSAIGTFKGKPGTNALKFLNLIRQQSTFEMRSEDVTLGRKSETKTWRKHVDQYIVGKLMNLAFQRYIVVILGVRISEVFWILVSTSNPSTQMRWWTGKEIDRLQGLSQFSGKKRTWCQCYSMSRSELLFAGCRWAALGQLFFHCTSHLRLDKSILLESKHDMLV